MATLSTTELAELRNAHQATDYLGTRTKTEFNAAFQQIEDWWESPAGRSALGLAITGTWTNAQKRALVKHWMRQKVGRGG